MLDYNVDRRVRRHRRRQAEVHDRVVKAQFPEMTSQKSKASK